MLKGLRRYSWRAGNPGGTDWYLVSAHGAILFYIAYNPGCTGSDIAEELYVTRRTVSGLIGALRRASMLNVRKQGRIHHYTVNQDAAIRLPGLNRGLPVHLLLGGIVPSNQKQPLRRR